MFIPHLWVLATQFLKIYLYPHLNQNLLNVFCCVSLDPNPYSKCPVETADIVQAPSNGNNFFTITHWNILHFNYFHSSQKQKRHNYATQILKVLVESPSLSSEGTSGCHRKETKRPDTTRTRSSFS